MSTHDFFKSLGLQEEYIDAQEGDCQYMSFKPDGGPWVDVEATAFNFVENITKLTYDLQCKVMVGLANLVPDEGDRILIVHTDGDRKRRSARVVRTKGSSGRISLLITR